MEDVALPLMLTLEPLSPLERAAFRLHDVFGLDFRRHRSELVRVRLINGVPGFVAREADGELQTTALDIEDGRVVAIDVMRNPEKLRHLH